MGEKIPINGSRMREDNSNFINSSNNYNSKANTLNTFYNDTNEGFSISSN